MKRILVLITGETSDDAVLGSALCVAKKFNAHLDVLYAPFARRMELPEGIPQRIREEVISYIEAAAEKQATEARVVFDKWLEGNGVELRDAPGPNSVASACWHATAQSGAEAVAKRGNAHDLIILNRPVGSPSGESYARAISAIFETGTPVLLAPRIPQERIGRSMVIGWDGSVEAARALQCAMPFAGLAKEIKVVTIGAAESGGAGSLDIASRLAWNGVVTQVAEIPNSALSDGEVLLSEAEKFNSDLLVIGAYSHNRLQETIFGGVTRHVLEHAEIPVLMAH